MRTRLSLAVVCLCLPVVAITGCIGHLLATPGHRQGLSLHDKRLTNLDVSACTNLKGLGCSGNQLAALDVSSCTNLRSLDCSQNSITDLSSLVANAFLGGLGTGDMVVLSGNPLSAFARTNQIPILRSLGATVCWP